MDDDKAAGIADALEALTINQTALRAGLEEVSTWIRQRGSINVHDNVMSALQTMALNTHSIDFVTQRLRS
jgi:hypothetical protein